MVLLTSVDRADAHCVNRIAELRRGQRRTPWLAAECIMPTILIIGLLLEQHGLGAADTAGSGKNYRDSRLSTLPLAARSDARSSSLVRCSI